MADKVVVIEEGKIAQFATPEIIINEPKGKFVEKFILDQLRIKRDHIYQLFGASYGT